MEEATRRADVWQAVALVRFDLRHQCAKPRKCPGCQVLRAHLVSRKGQVSWAGG